MFPYPQQRVEDVSRFCKKLKHKRKKAKKNPVPLSVAWFVAILSMRTISKKC